MSLETQFSEISLLIAKAKQKAILKVNASLIELYWKIGKYVHQKVRDNEWGKSIVVDLAKFIQRTEPNIQGFSERNIWRMKQFYETYTNDNFLKLPAMLAVLKSDVVDEDKILSTLLTELSWSAHLEIISGSKSPEEKLFYLLKYKTEKWSYRELKRQIKSCMFERTMIGSNTMKHNQVLKQTADIFFKDSYVLEFLSLPTQHNENEIQKAIVSNIKNFILEFGRDFAFMSEEFRIQVGNQDFFIDLLFYHRTLQCLVAIELKTERFSPEHLAQINFYLEALDRDVKKKKENPSIGILLCKGKDDVVVEYALSRTLKPAMVANYQLALPNKKLLHDKWQEILDLNEIKGNEK